MSKLLYSFGIISFGLFTGYVVQRLNQKGLLYLPLPVSDIRKHLQRFALLVLNPVAIVGAIWIVSVENASLAILPFLGFFSLALGGVLALGAAKLLSLERRKTGAMFGCGSFTNIGSIGALICFIFLGEPGFALVPIYKLFEEVSYYGIGFPIAKYYSGTGAGTSGISIRLIELIKDPFIIVSVSSILIGAALNLSNLNRPLWYGTVNAVFIPFAAILLLISIGLALRFSATRDYLRECASISLIKFFIVPVSASLSAYLLGLGNIENGIPLKVVVILASMPVAFNALIPPSIYDLDIDLANSCWFVTTVFLVIVLPVLLFVTQRL